MRYALDISPAGELGDPRSMAELARLAEAAGWDGIFVEDYLVHPLAAETYDPWITLAAMALATERLVLGIHVVALPRRRPQMVARQALTLDAISDGRFVLGVGSGDHTSVDFTAFDEERDLRRRAALLDEGLALIAGLWSGDPFALQPPSRARPRIPVWVGGRLTARGPRERAARWDGACLYRAEPPDWVDVTPEDVRAMLERAAAVRGPEAAPYDVCVGGRQRLENLDEEREYGAAIAAAGATWRAEFVPPNLPPDELRRRVEGGPLRSD
jgi:alkanesulfonate monooxygenase SsuD/methylene tetrahydromethanopterin reductase-like flavin-dependent oxidoreductase (luciferase family)